MICLIVFSFMLRNLAVWRLLTVAGGWEKKDSKDTYYPGEGIEVGKQRTFARVVCLRNRLVKIDKYIIRRSLNARLRILYMLLIEKNPSFWILIWNRNVVKRWKAEGRNTIEFNYSSWGKKWWWDWGKGYRFEKKCWHWHW